MTSTMPERARADVATTASPRLDRSPPTERKLRIGMLGMWGMNVPGKQFAGFESAFSEVGPRLVQAGHEVVIYCRKGEYPPELRVPSYDGVRLVYVPSWGGKNFSGILATLFSVLHAVLFERFDLLFFVNVGMGHHCALARLFGKKVVLNVDGLDWKRGKWGRLGRAYFLSAAHVAVRVCNRLVTDAEGMRRFYLDHFAKDTTMIAYGAHVEASSAPELLERYGVRAREYYLVVSRLIPENNLDIMLEGYLASGSSKKLVLVGSANYESPFHQRLRALANENVIFTGHVHEPATLRELWCNAFIYLHGHSVGGTNPALLRAMGCGSCVVAHDNVFNREVLGDCGAYFSRDANELGRTLRALEADLPRVATFRARAPERIVREYSWEKITAQYSALFQAVAGVDSPP